MTTTACFSSPRARCLQSQNAGVVMAVGALHFYLAPISDIPKVLRALVFAMRCKPESQLIMLKNICAMVATQASLFRTHFAAFYVHPADSLEMRALKLEILTHVANRGRTPPRYSASSRRTSDRPTTSSSR